MVGLEKNIQVSEPNTKIDLEDDSLEECFNDEQDQNMASD